MYEFLYAIASGLSVAGPIAKNLGQMADGSRKVLQFFDYVWNKYCLSIPDTQQKVVIQQTIVDIVNIPQAELEDMIIDIVARQLNGQPEIYHQAVINYMSSIPDHIRSTLIRDDDPTGKTLPTRFELESEKELEAILPNPFMITAWFYFSRRQYELALEWYKEAARSGNFRAVEFVHSIYSEVKYLGDRDYAELTTWYRNAAESGNDDAMMTLAYMYETGEGVSQNYVEAVNWFRRAAAKGNYEAMQEISSMYSNGKGVMQNDKLASEWSRSAEIAKAKMISQS